MRITIKHKDTEITVDEANTSEKDRLSTMRWDDQNKHIQETIIVMCEQIKKLENTK